MNALMGRSMGPSDDRHSVAVLSHGFWSRRFGADPSILGRTVRVNGEPFTVVGVMPPAFFGVDRSEIPDLWLPIPAGVRPQAEVWVLGHLKPGVSVSQAQTVLEPLFGQALESLTGEIERWPERDRKVFLSQKLLIRSATSGTVGLEWTYWKGNATLKVLMGLTVLVLLIACVNLANLLMARSANRTREIGIRLGIGAGRFRLVRQLLTENLLLSLAGGAIGLVVAAWGHRLLLGFLVRDPQTVALDFRRLYLRHRQCAHSRPARPWHPEFRPVAVQGIPAAGEDARSVPRRSSQRLQYGSVQRSEYQCYFQFVWPRIVRGEFAPAAAVRSEVALVSGSACRRLPPRPFGKSGC
ncbi:MAG: ABC transporter permease [Burkholderiaceae bacterium]|nr:ABC transporter permease [Burkholderiaceae bacterium]